MWFYFVFFFIMGYENMEIHKGHRTGAAVCVGVSLHFK